ncbi:MAG TPA: ATP-binding protein, partial [Thermoanaerobaculia bacterium]
VSHELRTPLNAIKGWVHLLRVQRSDADLLERGLATIEKNSDLQSQLVEDLLDVSRIITGRIRLAVEPVDLAAVVRDAVEAIRPAAEAKGVRLQVVSGNGDCAAMGDRGRLVQVVWNLLSNGVKFTPKGGRVQVVLQRINSHVEIVVSDTGEGIPPDVLPYVFDRFRQADASTTRRHGGLGLGLSIVRHLVELHGGLVLADSPGPSQGATFTVSLPVPLFTRAEGVAPAALPAGAPEESLGPAPLAGLHALLVEDHEDSLLLLREILEDAGARVTPSATSPDALAAFQAEPPDVVVSDIELPGEDGYTLIRKLRDHEARLGLPRTPAVAVTAYAGGEFRLRALRAGFQSFVPKPVAPVELLTVIASVTGRT